MLTHTKTLLHNFARRDAHRISQKVSLLVMLGLVVICQWAQGLINIAMPDEAMVIIVVGVLAYVIANRAAQYMLTTDRRSEEELLSMFVNVDPQ